MKNTQRNPFSVFALSAAALFALASCEQEGPAERAGEKVDEAVEEVQDEIDDATTE